MRADRQTSRTLDTQTDTLTNQLANTQTDGPNCRDRQTGYAGKRESAAAWQKKEKKKQLN